MIRPMLPMTVLLIAFVCRAARPDGSAPIQDAGPLARSLWLVQRYGTAEAIDPRNDQKTKGALSKALGKDAVLIAEEVKGLIEPDTFAGLAGADGRLETREVRQMMANDTPPSRRQLHAPVEAHAKLLTTSFDMLGTAHLEAADALADWIVANAKPGRPLEITCVCTGNSRRSILAATMGNVAAAYYGMPEVRFHSGGTAPSAFNSRTVAALRQIGVEVEPTGAEAPRGEPKTPNPIYTIRWGRAGISGQPPMEATEFSKHYADPSNPQAGFAALMVCGEADAGCPIVKGASARISMPYLDPKIYDDGVYESHKYDERRDDIGRLMLSALMRARNRLANR